VRQARAELLDQLEARRSEQVQALHAAMTEPLAQLLATDAALAALSGP
jgi:hypothetical protein